MMLDHGPVHGAPGVLTLRLASSVRGYTPRMGKWIFIAGLVLGFVFHEVNNHSGSAPYILSGVCTAVALLVGLPWWIVSAVRRRKASAR